MSMKNSSDTIGNRTRDLPACSAVPQPTVPPHTPDLLLKIQITVNSVFIEDTDNCEQCV